jgi:diguanylate cyclase (GGDEF)-like protein
MWTRLSQAFNQLLMRNVVAPYVVVLAGVELVVGAYYWLFEPSRLSFELAISAAITMTVGFPTIWYFMRQHRLLQVLSRELEVMSATDQMTGLLNRQTFLRRLAVSLEEMQWGESAGAFAYIDADRFKSINDMFGHDVGDQVIELIAESMKASVRRGDLLARLGGEEFAIFLHGATVPQAAAASERLREEIRQRAALLTVPGLKVSVSIGIASHQPGEDAHSVMHEADRSLYAAKRVGRDSVVIDLRKFRAA